MSQTAIEALLRQKIGLDANVIGSTTIARAIRERLLACGLSDLTTYLTRLKSSSAEFDALIEAIIVPETWFFRDREAFAFLRQFVKSEWRSTHPNDVLRVLSVPCSTGEEPYSIAITLLDAGLSPRHIHIDAIDISQNSLRKAKRGLYKQNSFRGNTLSLGNAYFTQTTEGYQLDESVRQSVNFIHGNILDLPWPPEKAPYSIIFCRNLLIYLEPSARAKTLQILDRLLVKNGLLFVGHSETAQISASRFLSVRHPFTFAFRKVDNSPSVKGIDEQRNRETTQRYYHTKKTFSATQPDFSQSQTSRSNTLTAKQLLKQNPPLLPPLTPQTLEEPNKGKTLLKTAKDLADQGQLKEAATLCETYLSQNRLNPEAYFLLGQVHQAEGKEQQAEQYFHKAIYLKPNYNEALLHLALLKEHHGDFKSAALIRQRIQRINQSSG